MVPVLVRKREIRMIAFACSHCGLKLKVKPEFAGRSSRCPTCQQPLVVPVPDQTQAHVAAGPVDGTPSSLHRAGVASEVTLPPAAAAAHTSQKAVADILAGRT